MRDACRGVRVGLGRLAAATWLATAGASAEDAPAAESEPKVQFAPRPPEAELAPMNEEEARASVVILRYDIEISADISSWSGSGSTRQRHKVRYLVMDNTGAKTLSQHQFFGDEEGVSIERVRGRTLAPDGGIHPIDPEKDIRRLDVTDVGGDEDRGSFRTVNFPRVEPGAVLDLAWEVDRKGLPSLETVTLEGEFPVREMNVKSQGTLIGLGKSIIMMGAQYYWVPFFVSRIPENVHARLSSRMDLELTAHNLRTAKWEPMAPSLVRVGATLGIIPLSFGGGSWARHVLLFGDNPAIPPPVEKGPVWLEGDLRPEFALAEIDALGLQGVPLPARAAKSLEFFQTGLRGISSDYRKFVSKARTGETASDVEAIADASLSWSERVDILFAHARDRVVLDPYAKERRTLDALLEAGEGDADALLYYTKYLLETAGIPARLAIVFSRHGPPFLPVFETWTPFPRTVVLEVGPEGEGRRYIEPGDVFANSRSFQDANLGGVLLRDPGEKRDWTIDRVPLDANVSERVVVSYAAEIAEFGAATPLHVRIDSFDSAANYNRWALGYPVPKQDVSALSERRQRIVKAWLEFWTGVDVAESTPVAVPDPRAEVAAPLRVEADLDWIADVQALKRELIVPALPPAALYHNVLVAEQREHALWLRGGEFDVSATWTIPPGYRLVESAPLTADGPGGLHYEIARQADPSSRTVTTRLTMRQPYILPASDYAATRSFFEGLQRDAGQPLLLER